MRLTVDTNVLLRILVQDDPSQAAIAQALLQRATVIAVPTTVLCECAWVLKRTYGYADEDVAAAIQAILKAEAVATDVPTIEAGLQALRSGADFADGVIAHQGIAQGGTIFASFDRSAVAHLQADGVVAADPADLLEQSTTGNAEH